MKKNRIMTCIGFALAIYAYAAVDLGLCYLLTDVLGWTWLMNLSGGLTYTQLMAKQLASPLYVTIYAIEIFGIIPFLAYYFGNLWIDRKFLNKSN